MASQGFQLSLVSQFLSTCGPYITWSSVTRTSVWNSLLVQQWSMGCKQIKDKATNKSAIKPRGRKEIQMQCSSFGQLFLLKRLFSFLKKKCLLTRTKTRLAKEWEQVLTFRSTSSLISHSYFVLSLNLNIHKTTIHLLFKVKLTKNKLTGLA